MNELSQMASKLGKLGGLATSKKYGKSHFSNAGKAGMKKRWGKGKMSKVLGRLEKSMSTDSLQG